MPDEPEPHGLLALMLRTTRAAPRAFAGEESCSCTSRNRALWDAAEIAEGRAILERALALRGAALRPAGRDRVAAGARARRLARGRCALR